MSYSSNERLPGNNLTPILFLTSALVRVAELGVEQETRAIEAERNQALMEDLAMLDTRTGLPNLRALEDAYDKLHLKGVHRRRTDAETGVSSLGEHCLMLIDVDNFKSINDKLGHEAGNETLRNIATVLRSRKREGDMAARIGGDEFAVLLPNTPSENAHIVAEDIGKMLLEKDSNTTLSIGISSVDTHRTLDQNLELADKALYKAKIKRNGIKHYSEPSS